MTQDTTRPHAKRGYLVDGNGVRLPSVTTILNATKPPEAREALARWRDRLGDAEALQVSTAASRRGSQTHRQIRRYLRGESLACPEAVKPYWESLESVLAAIQEVRLVEETVFHYEMGYAGKVDCVASYQGVPCVVDWKTADRPKATVDRLYDGPLQLAAYCGAVNHSYPDWSLPLKQAILVVAIPHQPAEVFWFDAAAMVHYWQQWQQRLEQYYRQQRWRSQS